MSPRERELARWALRIDGSRGAVGGIAGGMAMAAYEMMAMWAVGPGLLAPLELIGAAHPITEGAVGVLVGLGAHLITAGYWGVKLGIIVGAAPERLRRGPTPLLLGAVWGIAVWAVMGKIVGPILDPAIARVPEPHFLVGHLIYGTVAWALTAWLSRAFPVRRSVRRRGRAHRRGAVPRQGAAARRMTSGSRAAPRDYGPWV